MRDLCAAREALKEIVDGRNEDERALSASDSRPDDGAIKLKLNRPVDEDNLPVHSPDSLQTTEQRTNERQYRRLIQTFPRMVKRAS
jgi:hypothetical protein